MNRRTFLKTVGAAVAVISIPAIAKTSYKTDSYKMTMVDWQKDFMPLKPKWIKFADAQPKVGQKIIIVSQVSLLGSICGGVVKELPDRPRDSKNVALSTTDDFYVGYTGGYPIGLFYSEEGKDVLSTRDWIREREFIIPRDYTESVRSDPYYIGYDKETYFWLAVDGEYPKTIPPIPRNPIFDELEGIKPGELNTMFADFGIRRKRSNNINEWPSHCVKGKS
jgi:hypothetical protein